MGLKRLVRSGRLLTPGRRTDRIPNARVTERVGEMTEENKYATVTWAYLKMLGSVPWGFGVLV